MPDAVSEAPTRRPTRSPFGLRALSLMIIAIFAAVAASLYIGASRLDHDQEHRLLVDRTREIGSLLQSAIGTGLQQSLTALATAAQQSPATFARVAHAEIAATGTATIGLVRHAPSGWIVDTAVGPELKIGHALSDAQLAIVNAAGAQMQSTILPIGTHESRIVLTLGPPSAPAGTVLYASFPVDPTRPTPVTQSQPFHELNVALYVGTQPRAANLLLTTSQHVPLRGETATAVVPSGATNWLVVASARHNLAGAVASHVPILLLGVALLIGLAMTVVVEAIGRRRDYALALVAERTAALEDSLHELERTQLALVDNERLAALGQMAATVGHELRNPLSVLTNSMYLIRHGVSSATNERLERQLNTADREIAAATLIVSDLLEFARPRAANPTPVDVSDLLTEAVSVAPPPPNIEVRQQFDDAQVTADRDQLRQVILNLLTNAYDAMPSGGQLELRTHRNPDTVEIEVTDTGVGMDAETQARLFEPFFSRKTKGTGLGLAVSKRIIDNHEGTLDVASHEGEGTTITLRLPAAAVSVGAGQ